MLLPWIISAPVIPSGGLIISSDHVAEEEKNISVGTQQDFTIPCGSVVGHVIIKATWGYNNTSTTAPTLAISAGSLIDSPGHFYGPTQRQTHCGLWRSAINNSGNITFSMTAPGGILFNDIIVQAWTASGANSFNTTLVNSQEFGGGNLVLSQTGGLAGDEYFAVAAIHANGTTGTFNATGLVENAEFVDFRSQRSAFFYRDTAVSDGDRTITLAPTGDASATSDVMAAVLRVRA